ncbi:MAG: thiamine phosphate synthase [Aquificaceae bacterium]|nr:thiamine phosphate synthase [Aquificaceae bacterium]
MREKLHRLYAISDRKRRNPVESFRELLERGVRMFQLREKDMSARELYELAKTLRDITKERGALLFINSRVDIAISVGADGVHLPRDELSPKVVKSISSSLIVGYSAHSLEEALWAEKEGADYITLSPIFKTRSHPDAKPIGLETLKEVCERVCLPVYALGGVSFERAKQCYKNGAFGIAGIDMFL